MGEVVEFRPAAATTVEYFGGCPHCGRNDGYMNIGREHWFFCTRHKTKWLHGSNIFSGWRDEGEETWKLNGFRLAEYMSVTPVPKLLERP